MAVGDTSQPLEDGQIYAARSVIFKPHTNKAAIDALPNAQEGELAYAASEDEWYYYNGSWVPQAGEGGAAILTLVGSVDACVDCPADWTQVLYGFWNCVYRAYNSYSSGPCFCGQITGYVSGSTSSYYWVAQSARYANSGSYYRCRICVK